MGNLPVAAYLIDKNADMELRSNDGKTPFLSACISDPERENAELLELLARRGADIHATTHDGAGAVFLAAQNDKPDTIYFL
jgi:ankyrin repeat protein